jgi:oligopeptide/dipeptide ABC transporter ATP-binding protein
MSVPLIAAERVSKHFPIGRRLFGAKRHLRAVTEVSFEVHEGETFALVGESGCGKSTTARLLLALEQPTEGRVLYRGRPVAALKGDELTAFRRRVQVVFQSSNASLNPRKTVGQILHTALTVSGVLPSNKTKLVRERVRALLTDVGLTPPEAFLSRYPHELSGGQRQRVGIARALATEPDVVVADEPVSALDISVRAQILALLARLQAERHLSFVFISHDLAVVRAVAHRVGVMYLGRLIEVGPVKDVFERPLHPYAEVLIGATPASHPRIARERAQLVVFGDVPSPVEIPPGCPFHPRCPIARDVCREKLLPLREVAPGVQAACHFAEDRLRNDPATSLRGDLHE